MGTYLTEESRLKQLNRVKAYYEENKVEINKRSRINRADAKLRTEAEKKEIRAELARARYLKNREDVISKQKTYYQDNKEALITAQIARRRKQRAEKVASGGVNVVKPLSKSSIRDGNTSTLIARAAIAKHLVISLVALDRIARTPRYEMPKHASVHVNGAYLYNRKEIEGWYPYARELLSWAVAGERVSRSRRPFAFKVGTLGHAMIMFMRNNKKIIEYCNKERLTLRTEFVDGL